MCQPTETHHSDLQLIEVNALR